MGHENYLCNSNCDSDSMYYMYMYMYNNIFCFVFSSDVPSPDSRTVDSELMETEVTSPDPIHTSSSMSITPMTPLQPIWTGTLSMHGMEKFSAVAYPVSGQTDGIELVNM